MQLIDRLRRALADDYLVDERLYFTLDERHSDVYIADVQ